MPFHGNHGSDSFGDKPLRRSNLPNSTLYWKTTGGPIEKEGDLPSPHRLKAS